MGILLRNKNLISPTALLTLFFQLLRCPDKELRSFLKNHIITDIKNVNSKSKNVKLNNVLQNFMFGMLKDSNAIAAKMSLDVMMELYRKNIWNDHKTVNVISTACLSKVTKIMVTALQFFMGSDEKPDEGEDEDGWESVNGEEDESSDDDDEELSAVTGESSEKRNLSKWEKKKQKRMQSDLKSMRKKTVAEAEDVSVMEERKTKAAAVSLNRILTDKDFARIDAAQVKKQVQATKSQKKRNAGDDITESNNRSELVRLDDIEKIHKKRRHDKDTRLATVLEGRADREKPTMKPKRQNPFASTSNREKSKNKNFMMLKQKAKGKQRRSFKDKQLTLKNALLKRKKMALKKK